MADFIGGGLPSVAAHTDPTPAAVITETSAPIATLEPPKSNPGSDDPTAGIAEGAGGVSSTAHVGSPVTEEHDQKQTIAGAVYESVFGKTERSAEEHESTAAATAAPTVASTEGTESQATGTGAAGVLGAVAGAAAAGTAAVAGYVGLSSAETKPEEEGEKTAAAVEKNVAETQAAVSEKVEETTAAVSDKVEETKAAVSDKVEETKAAASEKAEETKAAAEPAEHDAPSEAELKAKKEEDHKAAVRENKDSIPTAGGEKLGEAHEGESKVIPEVPEVAAEEATPGQPDATTAKNTAANIGDVPADAPAPAVVAPTKRMSVLGFKRGESSSADKPKFLDRVKAKFSGNKKDKEVK